MRVATWAVGSRLRTHHSSRPRQGIHGGYISMDMATQPRYPVYGNTSCSRSCRVDGQMATSIGRPLLSSIDASRAVAIRQCGHPTLHSARFHLRVRGLSRFSFQGQKNVAAANYIDVQTPDKRHPFKHRTTNRITYSIHDNGVSSTQARVLHHGRDSCGNRAWNRHYHLRR